MQDFYNPEKHEQFIHTLYKALTEIGFFAVRNTGVDREVIQEAYTRAKFKAKCFLPESRGQREFVPRETAKGNRAKDYK
jgi:isopenicillin N synthase-like dioxygenase